MKNYIRLFLAALFFFCNIDWALAQDVTISFDNLPFGESTTRFSDIDDPNEIDHTIVITKKKIILDGYKEIFTADPNEDIVSVTQPSYSELIVVTNKGAVLRLNRNSTTWAWYTTILDPIPSNYCREVKADENEVCVMTYNAVYSSEDGYNWVIDTAGLSLNGAYCNDIEKDTAGATWMVSQSAVYYKETDEWDENDAYPASGGEELFIDREEDVWISNYNDLYFTDDGGQSFQNGPSGLPNDYIRDICDDAYGNMYVMFDNEIYYSEDGTEAFINITQNIQDDFELYETSYLFNDIEGDTAIHLSTIAGVYSSDDQGATWVYEEEAVRAEHINSVCVTDDDRLLMSSNNGAFRRSLNNNWSQIYPQDGFAPDTKMFTADNGDIYMVAENVGVNSSNSFVRLVYKSTDDGTTFLPDTAGMGAADVAISDFFVDENGVQHASGSVYVAGSGNFLAIWKKIPGQPWELDVFGLPASMGSSYSQQCFGTDHNGKVYVAISNWGVGSTTIYSRPIAGGSWTSETAVFGAVINIKGRNGTVTAGTEYGLIYNTGGGWQSASTPSAITEPVTWSISEVDNNDVVWGYFEIIADNASLGQGIYYTDDFVNWSQPQENVDSIFFAELVAIGDSIFALTRGNDGVYVFDTIPSVITGIAETEDINVSIVPNPFQNTTSLQFHLDATSNVTLNIYNVLGQTVFNIPAQQMSEGTQQLKINLPNTNNGILLYELKVNDAVYKGKIVQQ